MVCADSVSYRRRQAFCVCWALQCWVRCSWYPLDPTVRVSPRIPPITAGRRCLAVVAVPRLTRNPPATAEGIGCTGYQRCPSCSPSCCEDLTTNPVFPLLSVLVQVVASTPARKNTRSPMSPRVIVKWRRLTSFMSCTSVMYTLSPSAKVWGPLVVTSTSCRTSTLVGGPPASLSLISTVWPGVVVNSPLTTVTITSVKVMVSRTIPAALDPV
mmetsp:Transcript_42562/g.102587  ORF Transcript_42562/g.102587 Transcript_42562/m.102587 type:complete len:213 (-) Transcript_42562:930-1568(-)